MKIKIIMGFFLVFLIINIIYVNADGCKDINFKRIKIKGDLNDKLVRNAVAPDETIEIKNLEITNKINRDINITIELILNDTNKNIVVEKIKFDNNKIADRDSKKFNFKLKVPKEIDENDVYNLQIKTYENIKEPKNCDEKSTSVDIGSEYRLNFFQKAVNWVKDIIT